MFEVTLLFLFMLFIAACAFLPLGRSNSCSNSEQMTIPEDSTTTLHFLTHLQNEIEAALFPRPTDSILQRHYDALVNAELENRLAAMPDS